MSLAGINCLENTLEIYGTKSKNNMCVMSMIMDHQYDEWNDKYRGQITVQPKKFPTQEEIEEFRILLLIRVIKLI